MKASLSEHPLEAVRAKLSSRCASASVPVVPHIEPSNARRVIVLGAGASAADGAPTQEGLFRKYVEIINRPESSHRTCERDIATLFFSLWGIDIDRNMKQQHFPTFEEVLGLLELSVARGESFKRFGGMHQETPRSHRLRAHLISLIATVLEDTLQCENVHHSGLVRALKGLGWQGRTDFISLNYDILIDNALRDDLAGTEPDYAVTFRSGLDGGVTESKLLKIHGSLNWMFCPTCNKIDLYPGTKIVATIARHPGQMTCPTCDDPRMPIVVPPTFFKVMSNFYLQQIWKAAEETLMQADHIIFCGYSFPDADLHFKYLLKRAEINRRDENHPPEVFVVNEHTGKSDYQRDAEKDRFLRFYRNKGLVHWTKLSFADFATNPGRYAEGDSWA
jgi:NAD-dependent SIR2 family protein deacetylase